MPKPQQEFHLPQGTWKPAGPEGMWELVLAQDPTSGDYTRLLRLDPGTDTSATGVLTHDFHEEVYIIHGDLTDVRLGETFYGGMYASRQPGMEHGPYRTRNGCLMVEARYGFPSTCAAYLVLYEGRPADPESFLRYYLEEHIPLVWRFPNIRGIDLDLGRDDGDFFMVVRLLFDDLDDLRAAVASPERERARADMRDNLPRFDGRVRHQVVETTGVTAGAGANPRPSA